MTGAAFYFDLGSPLAYVAAERILHELPVAAEWQPVLARELVPAGSSELARGSGPGPRGSGPGPGGGEELRELVAREVAEHGLQPLRWPEPFPFDSALAMRVASYAKQIGRAVAFAQAAFRQAYAGGRSLQERDSVLIAAAACEMHPQAVLCAAELRSTSQRLAAATAAAAAAGVREVPAIVVPRGRGLAPLLFQGAGALDIAVRAL